MKNGLYLPDGTFMQFSDNTAASATSLSEELAVRSRSIDYLAIGNMYLPNPDPVLKAKGRDIEIYSDLLIDDRVGGSVTNRINATLALNWQIDKDKSSKSRQAKAIESAFANLNINTIIEAILKARAFGYAPLEVIWGQSDGLTLPLDVIGKPQRWFVFGQDNDLRFRSRDHLMDGEELPPRKFLCPTSEATYDTPYGLGNLSRCFWPCVFKKGGWRFWVQFSEKYGQLWPVGKLPRSATPEQASEFLDILVRMIADGAAVIPDDGSVEFKESGTKSATSELYQGIIAEANSAISTVWLGHAGAGQSVEGELGGKDVASKVREDLRDSDKTLVEQTLNELIDWTCEINWNTAKGAPRFSLWEEEEVDQAQATRDKDLSESMQRSGLRFSRTYFQRTYNLEETDIEEAPAPPEPKPVMPAKEPQQFADPVLPDADGPDSADVVADQLDAAARPHIERWIARLAKEVDVAGNLVDLRESLISAQGLDLAPLAGTIRDALILSRLAARAEVLDEIAASEAGNSFVEPALASALRLPFAEAIAFFRNKLSIPTEKWNDLWLDAHSQGFMIAGALKGELLADIRAAVDQAISHGITLADFRKSWDAIVERHGWQYKGGRNWRTRVVYETNTRQAYNAGRWQQVTDPDVLRTRPYLLYKHGDSINPRIPHLSWDGTVLLADDPWWGTHTPQNGWGCKCKIFSAGERDIKRLGEKAKRTAPNDGTYAWTDKQGRSFQIPNGIDPGFQYNPGAAATKGRQALEDSITRLPSDIGKQVRADIARES